MGRKGKGQSEGVGALLRAEKRVGTPRALACAGPMARGELIPDELALEVLSRAGGPTLRVRARVRVRLS